MYDIEIGMVIVLSLDRIFFFCIINSFGAVSGNHSMLMSISIFTSMFVACQHRVYSTSYIYR